MAGVSLSAVERLAASRLRWAQARHAPAPAPLSSQIQALLAPTIQRHPWRWMVGALASGGVLAATWKHLPRASREALLNAAQALGQEALLQAWIQAMCVGTVPDAASADAPAPP
ncbi:hypothetical protein [Ideonella sp.]|jgi:hypothetical protein|uniref:hypothetical protein n=1 Tax=Ideonella sp. TaxID=1929293 RepID=UPI0037BE5D18